MGEGGGEECVRRRVVLERFSTRVREVRLPAEKREGMKTLYA